MGCMDRPTSRTTGSTLTDLVTESGIAVTEEGRSRARAKLTAAADQMPPERLANLREELGLPPRSTAA